MNLDRTPNKDWPFEETLMWLKAKDYPLTNKVYYRVAQFYKMNPTALYIKATGNTLEGNLELDLVTANSAYGPLTFEQKEEIYKYHYECSTAYLALVYNTNAQNTRLAKKGVHRRPAREKQEIIVDPCTANREYGPLSVAQKVEIYDHHQNINAVILASQYNTNAQNVRIAKNTPPQHWRK